MSWKKNTEIAFSSKEVGLILFKEFINVSTFLNKGEENRRKGARRKFWLRFIKEKTDAI